MLASLNHPGIATIHGIEESQEALACSCSSLVEGGTLADRIIAARALPIDETLAMARQIADALDAAHERGIVYCDLKPSNVAVTSAGVVKVLDFGIAKTTSTQVSAARIAANESDTVAVTAVAATHAGQVLGTAAYMSPEQARGHSVDKRADIWALAASCSRC